MPSRFFLVSAIFASACMAQYKTFITRPRDNALNITVLVNRNPNALAPGLWFLSPYILGGQYLGPQIYTSDGTLVWNGNASVAADAYDAHVCNYLGTTAICYNDGTEPEQGGHATGHNVLLTHGYTPAGPAISGTGGLRDPDNHETNTPGNQGANLLQTVYQPKQVNLQPYSGPSNGYILDGCFQDINLSDGSVYFEWCAADHLSLSDSYVLFNGSPNIPGDGHQIIHTNEIAGDASQKTPWDWFHINSVDRDANGDYLVSARHTSTVYKISGRQGFSAPAGQIIWTLGGKHSTFAMNYSFSSQHMARFLSTSGSTTTISLFDDATDGTYFSNSYSSGIVVTVDTQSRNSALLQRYTSPVGAISTSQGSMQVLNNNNALLGWGSQPYYSEFAQDGTLLYHAQFGSLPGGGVLPGINNYRAYKTEWLASPSAPPDLVIYSQRCSNSAVFGYASWNGATSVARWRFRGGTRNDPSSFTTLTSVGKTGFETGTVLQRGGTGKSGVLYVVVDALNTDGRVLRTSNVVKTFIPDSSSSGCGVASCAAGTDYTTATNSAGLCS